MAANTLGYNQEFPIYNADGTAFNNLVLKKSVVDSVVMSLGDKVTGDVYYRDNSLVVTMQEYIVVDDVKYTLVNPPTILREGMVSDNSQINGMTKYSFEFYHPMYMLGNIPFTDVAIDESQKKYLSQNKTFSWVGTLTEYVAKLNANLNYTEWLVVISPSVDVTVRQKTCEVLQFDKNFISDALKKEYDEWEVPFIITAIHEGGTGYSEGKRFLITLGLPSQEIYTVDAQGQPTSTPFVFRFGKGVGLKNNSRTPKNNKIVTRLVGYGAERNVPYGYPQIPWTGNQSWDYTINNDPNAANSYPIYDGIVGGQRVRLIKHPFTRTTLMPSIYAVTVNKKVNPYATGYDPDTEIIDYHDATNAFPNPINPLAPSVEIHQFEDIYPRLGDAEIISATPYDEDDEYYTYREWYNYIYARVARMVEQGKSGYDLVLITRLRDVTCNYTPDTADITPSASIQPYHFEWDEPQCVATLDVSIKGNFVYAKIVSSWYNETHKILQIHASPTPMWDDTMNDDGEYIQSYFKIKLPQLSFDLYASAAVTEEMTINMRSGSCVGCSFPVQVDWEDYKQNFYDSNGQFAPDGEQRDLDKYPKSNLGQIEVIVQKDNETFGRLIPNVYQQPVAGDKFVVLGISLPQSYINSAQTELDEMMDEYILENNVYYYEYPLKFDEHFLATHQGILAQMHNNSIVRFQYAGIEMALYIKQITIKYGESQLPQYDITITDDVEIVLNKIGQVTDDVSRMRVQVSELQKYYSENLIQAINSKLSKIEDDICMGRITFQQGLDAIGRVIFHDKLQSPDFEEGLYNGRGWRIDQLGNSEFESLRVRSFLEVVELLINRLQAQEGDTLFTDNDQIEKVQKIVAQDNSVSYILTLKEKYDGYISGQMYGNVLKGIINTLAAKDAGISDYESTSVEVDGENKYYTSWMRIIGTNATSGNLGVNQIQVVLYGDNQVPAGKNFEPCELMTIARWGCVDYSNPQDPDYDTVKASIIRRQRMFMISTTDGRVVKYTGVDAPILKNGNYGVTIGELPEFVKNYPDVRAILDQVGEHTDWLYAQGVVVGNYIKIDREGLPVPVNVFCGDWVNGSLVAEPTPGNGIYFYNEYNEQTMQYEIHEVRHMGGRWQCLQHQPVRQGGGDTYYEPRWNSAYWRLVDGNDNLTIEFVSSNGYSFRRGHVNTVVTPHLFYGNVDISNDVAAENWSWTRESESGKTDADRTWDAQHTGVKQISITNEDMPANWSSSNKAIFTLTVQVDDGKNIRIVDNQIIS
jgi:hypothetical protein